MAGTTPPKALRKMRAAMNSLMASPKEPVEPVEPEPEHPVRDGVTLYRRWGMDSYECAAGQSVEPVGCDRHSSHYWCVTCAGWFGVPHDRIHSGRDKHPNFHSRQGLCVCRPCREERGEKVPL